MISRGYGEQRRALDMKAVPPMTPLGKQLYDATKSEETPAGVPLSNSKDGMLICDPLGFPRLFAYNYGFEFVQLPDRVLQFFAHHLERRAETADGSAAAAMVGICRWQVGRRYVRCRVERL